MVSTGAGIEARIEAIRSYCCGWSVSWIVRDAGRIREVVLVSSGAVE